MKILTAFLILWLLPLTTLFAALPSGVQFSASFDNKQIYYKDSPIWIRLSVKNHSPEVYRFKIGDSKVFSVDFVVEDISGIALDYAEDFLRERNSSQPHFFREVTLQSGEEFSFVVALKDFVKMNDHGPYSVRALFFPELDYINRQEANPSNVLTLFVRPELSMASGDLAPLQEEIQTVLEQEQLYPDEVVSYFLRSRQVNDEERFFLYLDVENLLLFDERYGPLYRSSTAEERAKIIQRYKQQLWQASYGQLGLIPDSFKVNDTSYTDLSAKVSVDVLFDEENYFVVREYVFYLRKNGSFWVINNYSVHNKGVRSTRL